MGWRFIRLRVEEYEELRRLKEERGLSSFSDVIAELLRCKQAEKAQGESVENNGVEKPGQQKGALVILSDYAYDWLNGLRKRLSEAFGVELDLNDTMEIVGFAMATDKVARLYVETVVKDAVARALREAAKLRTTSFNAR